VNKRSQIEREFETYRELFRKELTRARMHFALYKLLQDAKKGYLKELNQAPVFFNFTISAHRDAGLMSLFRLLKKQEASLTLWKFLDFVDNNLSQLFSNEAFSARVPKHWINEGLLSHRKPPTRADIKDDRKKLAEFKEVIDHLITWRDKQVAHIDEQVALSQINIAQKFPIKLTKLEDLTMLMVDIINKYSTAYDSSTYAVDIVPQPEGYGTNRILEALRLELKQREEHAMEWQHRTAQ
jgi:hypothetical protein